MELPLTFVPSTPSILTRIEQLDLQLTRDLSHLAVKINVIDDMASSAYPQQPRAAYCGEYDEGLHTTVPETYPSANTAAKRSEIEVARPPLPDAIRNQPSDSTPTSKAPTMALDDVPQGLIRVTPGQSEILDSSGRTSSDAVAHG